MINSKNATCADSLGKSKNRPRRVARGTFGFTLETLPEHLFDPEKWPRPDLSNLGEADRERSDRFEKGIRAYLVNGKAAEAAKEAKVSRNTFLEIFDRCLLSDGEGGIVGWLGLVKHLHLRPYTVREPSEGKSGKFIELLSKYAEVHRQLDEYIAPKTRNGAPRDSRPQVTRVFAKFKTLLQAAGVGLNEYPFTTQSKGRRSVERYVKNFKERNPTLVAGHWFGQAAEKTLGLQTGFQGFDFGRRPLAFAQIDAHKIDCLGTIYIPGPAGLQPVVINRLWVIADVDSSRRVVFGYSVAIRVEVSADEIVEAIKFGSRPWSPKTLSIAGLKYKDGAGFPCGVIPGLQERRPSSFRFDNAAVHFSTAVLEGVRRATGAALTWGSIGAWWFNAIEERFFRSLENMGFQHISSGVGNQPKDPLKPSDSAGNAIRNRVTMDDLIELADVLFANHNATSTSALGHRSPLAALADDISSGDLVPRPSLPPSATSPALGILKVVRTVRGSVRIGRRPYVQYEGTRYTSPTLSASFELVGKEVVLHVDTEDLRTLTAFGPKGEPLAMLTVLGSYRHTKHTRAMRKIINGMRRSGDIYADAGDDVVAVYHDNLIAKAAEAVITAPKKVNRVATQVAHSSRKTGLPTTGSRKTQAADIEETLYRHRPEIEVDWSRGL